MITLGYDIGSSSVKATLFDSDAGSTIAFASYPDTEMPISAPAPGLAEQNPALWWDCIKHATQRLRAAAPQQLRRTAAIGIAYQMHGLVLIDGQVKVLRPSIIWCDSRAASIGREAFETLGHERCLTHLLNSPGNFTASKLRWVIQHEPRIAERARAMLLPGDYIAFRLTGDAVTTVPGLSEGMLWDFPENRPAGFLLEHYAIRPDLIPRTVPTFGNQGNVTGKAAEELGIPEGIPVTYRSGDQPNNALSLNVLRPGDVAATAGTSGVVYAVGDTLSSDPKSRINAFAHVNHAAGSPRIGILLCINGTGIANSWIRRMTGNAGAPYDKMNQSAALSPVGANGLAMLPFGNGAERMFEDRTLGAHLLHIDFTRHSQSDIFRSVQEGIAFSFVEGMEIMRSLGIRPGVIRAGEANMFLSPLFCEALASTSGVSIELYNTDGSQGAARGAAFGAGSFATLDEVARGLTRIRTVEPSPALVEPYHESYARWHKDLSHSR